MRKKNSRSRDMHNTVTRIAVRGLSQASRIKEIERLVGAERRSLSLAVFVKLDRLVRMTEKANIRIFGNGTRGSASKAVLDTRRMPVVHKYLHPFNIDGHLKGHLIIAKGGIAISADEHGGNSGIIFQDGLHVGNAVAQKKEIGGIGMSIKHRSKTVALAVDVGNNENFQTNRLSAQSIYCLCKRVL